MVLDSVEAKTIEKRSLRMESLTEQTRVVSKPWPQPRPLFFECCEEPAAGHERALQRHGSSLPSGTGGCPEAQGDVFFCWKAVD